MKSCCLKSLDHLNLTEMTLHLILFLTYMNFFVLLVGMFILVAKCFSIIKQYFFDNGFGVFCEMIIFKGGSMK